MSSSPLRKIVFIKRICLFASKNIPTLLVLSRSVNNEFSEALIEYGGFHETLTNLNHLALSSSARDQQPPILSFPIKRLIQFLSNYCSCAKWIFVELIEAKFMNPQRAIEFIFEGEDEDEIVECLKVLFRKAKKRDKEEREYLEMTKAVADDDEFSSCIMPPVMIFSSAHRLANTPVGLAQKLLAEKMMMKSDDTKSFSSLSTAYYSSNKNTNQVQSVIARLVPAPSSSSTISTTTNTITVNEDSVTKLDEELNLNKSRPLVLAAKRDLSKVFRVLLEEGEAEWNFFLTRAAGVPSVVCDYYVEESSENIEDLRKQCQKQQQQQQQEQQQQDDVNKVIEQIVRGIPSSSSSSVVADLRSKATHFLVKLFGDLSLKCLEVLFEFIIKKQQNSQGNKTIDELLRDDFLVEKNNKNRHQHVTPLLHLLPVRIGDVAFETCLRCGPKFGPWLTHEEIDIHRNHFFAVIKFLLRQRDNGLLPISEKLLHERSLLIACNNSLTNIDILKMLINLTQEAEERGGKYSLSNLINYCGKNCRADDDEDGFNYSLTPLLAAVTCKRLDLVEFFLSTNSMSNGENSNNIKVDVTKNLEDSNGVWIAFMERNYSLWAHRYEETMNMFVSNNNNQNENDNTTQAKKDSPERDEDWNMSWGDSEDTDDWSSTNKNDNNKNEPQQIKTNVVSSGLTLEAIVFSHKRKLQDTKIAKILEMMVEAKEKEKKGICHQQKKNMGGIKKD